MSQPQTPMSRTSTPCQQPSISLDRVSLSAGLVGAAVVFVLAEICGWWLAQLPPVLGDRLSVLLIVGLPVLGTVLSFPRVRCAAGSLFGPVSRRLRNLALGAGIAVFALVAWHSSIMCWQDMTRSMTTRALDMSPWMYSMWIPFLSAVLAIRQLLALLQFNRRALASRSR